MEELISKKHALTKGCKYRNFPALTFLICIYLRKVFLQFAKPLLLFRHFQFYFLRLALHLGHVGIVL